MKDGPTRVLLIEDDEDDYIITRDLLSQVEGTAYDLDWVAGYDTGLEVAARGGHDVCLLDYRLGEGRNGLDLMCEAAGRGCKTPIVLLTGQGDREVDAQAIEAGAADYLPKDRIDADLLERSIRHAIERRRAEEALRRSEDNYRTIFDTANDAVFVHDAETGGIIDVNHKMCEMYGYTPEEACHLSVGELGSGDPPYAEEDMLRWVKRAAEGKPQLFEWRAKRANGRLFWVEVNLKRVVIRGEDRLLAIVRDATDRKQVEEALRESEEKYRLLVETANEAIVVAQDGMLKFSNPKVVEITGYSPEELASKPFAEFIHPADREMVLERYRKRLQGAAFEQVYPFRIVAKNGRTRWVEISAVVIDWEGRPATLNFLTDITERRRAEQALRDSEEKYRLVTENIPVVVYSALPDEHSTSLLISGRIQELTGHTSEQFVADPELWTKTIHPDDREYVWAKIEKHRKEGVPLDVEYRIVTTDKATKWVRDKAKPAFDEEGHIIRIDGFMEDVTELKWMESQLLQAQKLESIGRLAAGIAHEINTPTQYVGDNTRFLQDSFADILELLRKYAQLLSAAKQGDRNPKVLADVETAAEEVDIEYLSEEIPQAIQQSLEGIERVATIVRAMKDFAHPDVDEKTPIDVNRAIENTIAVARNEWKFVADVETDLDPGLPLVPCLPGEINQVILNIIINAAHAISDVVGDGSSGKGTITVSTRHDGDWVEIRVGDTGTGIPEEARSRIFDPFFTTKGVGKGTGQGLAISYNGVVEKHGGTITFDTEIGSGTTFIVRLPILSETEVREEADVA